jgi:hypothetical protein
VLAPPPRLGNSFSELAPRSDNGIGFLGPELR